MSESELNPGHQEAYDAAKTNAEKIRELRAQVNNNLTIISGNDWKIAHTNDSEKAAELRSANKAVRAQIRNLEIEIKSLN
ncbi:MAG: hypothetical protein WDZ94_00630 [Patescibacteria group bacterium]